MGTVVSGQLVQTGIAVRGAGSGCGDSGQLTVSADRHSGKWRGQQVRGQWAWQAASGQWTRAAISGSRQQRQRGQLAVEQAAGSERVAGFPELLPTWLSSDHQSRAGGVQINQIDTDVALL